MLRGLKVVKNNSSTKTKENNEIEKEHDKETNEENPNKKRRLNQDEQSSSNLKKGAIGERERRLYTKGSFLQSHRKVKQSSSLRLTKPDSHTTASSSSQDTKTPPKEHPTDASPTQNGGSDSTLKTTSQNQNLNRDSTTKKSYSQPNQEQNDEDENKITAQAMKAKMLGDNEKYNKLMKKVEQLRKKKDTVVLPTVDTQGRAVKTSSNADHNSSFQEMAKHEKKYNYDEAVFSNIKDQQLFDADAEYDTHRKAPKKKKQTAKKSDPALQRAIAEYKKSEGAREKCILCFNGDRFRKNLMVALGEKTLLMLPPFGRQIVPGHCVMTSIEHRISCTDMEEDEVQELNRFKQSLVQMFAQEDNQKVLFIEHARNFKRQRHTCIECIPLSPGIVEEAPIFFKKAIMESESEWAQNVKLVSTQGKGIKRSIPPGFPYFHAEFGLSGGFAHVIEDEREFSATFGEETILGMLHQPVSEVKNKNFKNPKKQLGSMQQFLKKWQNYDWTQELDGGDY
eukprot:gb/GECH01000474.1/.p1 GENE.gb/GECH01000474.1/~~gb/GECH01000474.1/.p1  ORF type:complete len:509 (+),score=169.45 gb/GECH01000474.1/:1-1527(+)